MSKSLLLLALCALLASARFLAAEESKDGFAPLFNGKNLDGWKVKTDKPVDKDAWSVGEQMLIARPGSGWLSTTREYGDFVLRLEWRIPENGNSGVFVRVPELKAGEQPHVRGIEIQVLDDRGSQYAGKLKPWQYSGSIYGAVAAKGSKFRGKGEWNTFEITCRGEQLAVLMNGQKVAEADVSQDKTLQDRPRKGFIGLQNHGSGVEYRNIQIKVLE